MRSVFKMTWRTVKTFFGRYMAILLIVALSAGFLAGLKVTTTAMLKTGDDYFTEQNLYDFRLLSTLGFTDEDVEAFGKADGVAFAEGTHSIDVLGRYKEQTYALKFYAMPSSVNMPSLVAGRLPEAENECVLDADKFSEADIGSYIILNNENSEETLDSLTETRYHIVGLVNSPLHLGIDRGTTDIGSGSLYGFGYVVPSCFTSDIYTEVNLSLNDTAFIYTDEYDELTDKYEASITALCEERADKRYHDILDEYGVPEEFAEQMGIEKPSTYVLTRNENAGYMSFENDTAIIGAVANIFPIFFIMIAILVCITTMTRMVDEERTQIGVIKAMGFSNGKIMSKYLLYAGSATVLGWAVGFLLCTWGLPKIFWLAYNSIYDFAPIKFVFDGTLAVLTLVLSLVFILGSTFISCRRELVSVPATLIRPRSAKSGKRVFIERITPLWKRFSFLQKITLRNMFRYKQRALMMLIGISCCTGLLVTAFGIHDSMIDIGDIQYTDIQKYDLEVSLHEGKNADELSSVAGITDTLTLYTDHVDLKAEESLNSVNLLSFGKADNLSNYWDFHSGEDTVAMPELGEAIISPKVAEKLGLSVGDSVELRNSDMQSGTVKVSGIFDNHIYDYIVVSEETYTELFGEAEANTVYLLCDGDIEALASELTALKSVSGVTQLSLFGATVTDALTCLNYIIWLVVFFSAALAFIVIFNLTNINLAERSREIATVEVLGFYPKETESYVLKENLLLSAFAALLGLPLGKLFHLLVMSMVKIDLIHFNNVVHPLSYILAFIGTILFALIINRIMRRSIDKINMAESLKAVE